MVKYRSIHAKSVDLFWHDFWQFCTTFCQFCQLLATRPTVMGPSWAFPNVVTFFCTTEQTRKASQPLATILGILVYFNTVHRAGTNQVTFSSSSVDENHKPQNFKTSSRRARRHTKADFVNKNKDWKWLFQIWKSDHNSEFVQQNNAAQDWQNVFKVNNNKAKCRPCVSLHPARG